MANSSPERTDYATCYHTTGLLRAAIVINIRLAHTLRRHETHTPNVVIPDIAELTLIEVD